MCSGSDLSAGMKVTFLSVLFYFNIWMKSSLFWVDQTFCLCSENFNFSKEVLFLNNSPIDFNDRSETRPKLIFLIFLLQFEASIILTTPGSPRSQFLKLILETGWSTLSIKLCPMKTPDLDESLGFPPKLILLKFLLPSLNI